MSAINDSLRARRDAAVDVLERLASERPESATELIETLNAFLLAGGEAAHLRMMTYVAANPVLAPVPTEETDR